jgi:hypothetical protein
MSRLSHIPGDFGRILHRNPNLSSRSYPHGALPLSGKRAAHFLCLGAIVSCGGMRTREFSRVQNKFLIQPFMRAESYNAIDFAARCAPVPEGLCIVPGVE